MSKMFEVLTRGEYAASGLDLQQLMGEDTVLGTTPAGAPQNDPAESREPAPELQVDDLAKVPTLPLRLPGFGPLLPFDGGDARAGEQYRILRTKVLQDPRQPRMIVVTSSGPSDGKTVTVINLAGAMALRTAARILILDADFRRSTINEKLGFPSGPGLAGVLEGKCALSDAMIHVQQIPNLYVLPAGTPQVNPSELIDSPAWSSLRDRLRAAFTYIVVDSPPVIAVADYGLIEATCDGVIVVARQDHSDREQCLKVLGLVPKTKLIGVVMNCASGRFLNKDHAYGYYNYTSQGDAARKTGRLGPEPEVGHPGSRRKE